MTRPSPQIDNVTYRLVRSTPEAVALRTRAVEWSKACDADSLHAPDPGRTVRAAEREHRRFLDAAIQFAAKVAERSSEHMHLWAREGDPVILIPLNRRASAWIRSYGFDGKAYMVRYWCESLTVRSPLDGRRRCTFGPQEATWAKIESEADRVAWQRKLEGRR